MRSACMHLLIFGGLIQCVSPQHAANTISSEDVPAADQRLADAGAQGSMDFGAEVQLGVSALPHLEEATRNGNRHPLVFFPGFGTSSLRVDVKQQQLEPDCPGSGTFHVAFGHLTVLEGWPEHCIYKLLELQYNSGQPDFNSRFSSQPGVDVSVEGFGSTSCAQIPYEPMFLLYENIGYTDGHDLFVACYDWRVSPYQDVAVDGAFLPRAQLLVERAFENTGLPVYLMAHSNGALQALALLNFVSPAWRAKHVAGLIGIAGNWAGQGSLYAPIFSGQSLFDSSWLPHAAAAWESWPSTYMSLPDPTVFGNSQVVIQADIDGQVKTYKTAEHAELFADANLSRAQQLASKLIGNLSAASSAPGTHFYGFYGSGSETLVGVTLPSLQQGVQPIPSGNFELPGDGNQEAADNLSVQRWKQTEDPCFHFELNERKGISHLGLVLSPSVLYQTIGILFTTPKDCYESGRISRAFERTQALQPRSVS